LTDVFSRLLDRFLALDEGSKRLAVSIGAAAAAAGPALVIFGQVLSTVGKLAPVFAALTGPLGLVVAGVVALAVAWKENWFGIRDITRTVIEGVQQTIGRMVQFFRAAKERGLDPFALAFRTLIVALGERLGMDHPVIDFLQEVFRLGRKLGDAFAARDFSAFVDELNRAGERLGTWIKEQLRDAATFGAGLFNQMIAGVRAINWSAIGDLIRDNLGRFADWAGDRLGDALGFGRDLLDAIINGLRGVPWSAVGTFVQVSLQGALTLLKDFGDWVLDRLREVDWEAVKANLALFAQGAVNAYIGMIHNSLLALKDLGTWVLDRVREVDWSSVLEAMSGFGLILIQELSNGMAKQLDKLDVWLTGGGDQAGIGGRIMLAIATSINTARDALVSLGEGAVRSLADGFWTAWDAFVEAVINTPWPNPGGDQAGESRSRSGPGSDPNKPAGTRAMGGPASRTVLVGERGPELVTVPAGSYVTPHGASMSRLQGMVQGFASGGMVGWRAWVDTLTRTERQRLRAIRSSGQLTGKARELLMSGGFDLFSGEWAVDRERDRVGRMRTDDPWEASQRVRTPRPERSSSSARGGPNFYGPVTFVMHSANIAREIERQLATGRRG
jgi:hypothetical protein